MELLFERVDQFETLQPEFIICALAVCSKLIQLKRIVLYLPKNCQFVNKINLLLSLLEGRYNFLFSKLQLLLLILNMNRIFRNTLDLSYVLQYVYYNFLSLFLTVFLHDFFLLKNQLHSMLVFLYFLPIVELKVFNFDGSLIFYHTEVLDVLEDIFNVLLLFSGDDLKSIVFKSLTIKLVSHFDIGSLKDFGFLELLLNKV